MHFFRAAVLATLALLVTAAPSSATTYAWPLSVSQPISVTNLTYSATSQLIVVCSITVPVTAGSGATTTVQGTTTVPVSAPPSGVVTYAGNVVVSMSGSPPPAPPQSGNVVTCTLREKTAGTFSNIGSETLKLP
jgi:hypothetical protein